MAKWYIDNLKLYYIDETGKLYIHAGIPLEKDADGEVKPVISLEDIAVMEKNAKEKLID